MRRTLRSHWKIGFSIAFSIAAFGGDPSPATEPARWPGIEPRLVHLRNDPVREWSSFPERAEAAQLDIRFDAKSNHTEFALRLRQQDVKQAWRVLLNDKPLGELVRDEGDLVIYLPIAPHGLIDGENRLRIECTARGAAASDDIRTGQLEFIERSVHEVLGEAALDIEVLDADTQRPVPARITIADANGSRQMTGATSNDQLAVRPGVVYTADGKARVTVPAGKYTLYAGRGLEFTLAQAELEVASGQAARHSLAIRREVPTPGYVACDTHVHTLTYSGHGDASIDERMITLAGEGIELPIATDHNTHSDYEPHARKLGLRPFFTPVTGNEFTTSVGHFNIFPVPSGTKPPDHQLNDWPAIFDAIFATPGVKVAILNHARDLHAGTRPFGPESFNAAIGDNLRDWPMRFNAMEVVNSGATQTDPLRLFQDWMAVLNRGYSVTPVGSSDSHDVTRYIVGQGRTYIRCDDSNVGALDVDAAVTNFLQGRVLVSYGLLTELTVNGKYKGGELAALAGNEIEVSVRVLGPHWVQPRRVQLYANGQLLRGQVIAATDRTTAGIKFEQTWKLPRPKHDMHLVAIALGKGVDGPFWPTAKPYQPTSPDWEPYTLGASGAVWLDGDSDGRRSAARDYAEWTYAAAGGNIEKLIAALTPYDAAVATQAAHLYRAGGGSLESEPLDAALQTASPAIREGFRTYWKAWRDNELARAGR